MNKKSPRKSRDVWEFGDFQTPDLLAYQVCQVISRRGIAPDSVLEPTCGHGSFLSAALASFKKASRLIGVDINSAHLSDARERLASDIATCRVSLFEGNFFKVNWDEILKGCPGSCLIIGNPPWVTSSELSLLESDNLPEKSNFHGRSGIEALTGKSNFDISEWMLHRYLDWLDKQGGNIAVLIKSVVARKLLSYVWKQSKPIKSAAIYKIDAITHFNASVDACLFVLNVEPGNHSMDCAVFDDLQAIKPSHTIGFHDDILIADVQAYQRNRHLFGYDSHYVWRSGIKHDCAKVMELIAENGHYRNGLGEETILEDSMLFPLFKSSDVSSGKKYRRFMLVTQKTIGEDTTHILSKAPHTWNYLLSHAPLLEKRSSSIYRNRPPFSIFGVGEYSFAPWKVAISGFYKNLRFVPVGPHGDKPVVFDDTVYFLPCQTKEEADFLAELLNSYPAQEFYNSMIFWSDKRPITSEILKRLSIAKLAKSLGLISRYNRFTRRRQNKVPQNDTVYLAKAV